MSPRQHQSSQLEARKAEIRVASIPPSVLFHQEGKKKNKTFLGTGDLEQNSAHDALAKSVAGLLVAAREAGKVSIHSVS